MQLFFDTSPFSIFIFIFKNFILCLARYLRLVLGPREDSHEKSGDLAC